MDQQNGDAEFLFSEVVGSNSDSGELSQNLLSETNQSFADWLNELNKSQPVYFVTPVPEYSVPVREISFEGTLRVDGYMAGLICCDEGTLILGPKGEIDGDIAVPVVIIKGCVRGDIRAAVRVDLKTDARVIGDIETLELSVAPGAFFEGHCTFPESAGDDSEPAAEAEPFVANQPEASFVAVV
jgi:cytoskeletal protein CcmA (bactofilin family)